MFVRLFVDENLDRSVPISKQPKDKIQAIIDACDRQFPEFHSRARKRIRTYLKSCRRMRRSKDGTWDQVLFRETVISLVTLPDYTCTLRIKGNTVNLNECFYHVCRFALHLPI